MFNFDLEEQLEKKLRKLSRKDKVLVQNFKWKLLEVISRNNESINSYKNLRSPMNELKRIHLTDNFILLFKVDIENNQILFVDIVHWKKAY